MEKGYLHTKPAGSFTLVSGYTIRSAEKGIYTLRKKGIGGSFLTINIMERWVLRYARHLTL